MKELVTNLKIQVIPGSKKNQIMEINDEGIVRVKVTAKPMEGKANKAVIDLISDNLGIRKSDVEIKSGLKSKRKMLIIYGLDEEEVRRRLIERIT